MFNLEIRMLYTLQSSYMYFCLLHVPSFTFFIITRCSDNVPSHRASANLSTFSLNCSPLYQWCACKAAYHATNFKCPNVLNGCDDDVLSLTVQPCSILRVRSLEIAVQMCTPAPMHSRTRVSSRPCDTDESTPRDYVFIDTR